MFRSHNDDVPVNMGAVQSHPIHSAVESGDLDRTMKMLQDDPTLINLKDDKGMTPLHTAASAFADQVDMVSMLLSYGADVQAKDNDGWTALDWADFWVNRDVAILLKRVEESIPSSRR